jgi:hypothetical protein
MTFWVSVMAGTNFKVACKFLFQPHSYSSRVRKWMKISDTAGVKRRADIGFQGRRAIAQPAYRWQRMSRTHKPGKTANAGTKRKIKKSKSEHTTYNKRTGILFSFFAIGVCSHFSRQHQHIKSGICCLLCDFPLCQRQRLGCFSE